MCDSVPRRQADYDEVDSQVDYRRSVHFLYRHFQIKAWLDKTQEGFAFVIAKLALRALQIDIWGQRDGHFTVCFLQYYSLRESYSRTSHWKCQEKPATLQTFYWKDHFYQHLYLVHGIENSSATDRKVEVRSHIYQFPPWVLSADFYWVARLEWSSCSSLLERNHNEGLEEL